MTLRYIMTLRHPGRDKSVIQSWLANDHGIRENIHPNSDYTESSWGHFPVDHVQPLDN